MTTDKKNTTVPEKENNTFPGYPPYPASDDIFNRDKEVDLNKEFAPQPEFIDDNMHTSNNKQFQKDSPNDLDIPGADLDDAQEEIGSEDEENNYYSIGGDNHDNLEDNQGDS